MDGIAVGPSLKKYIVVLTVLLLRSFGKLNGAVIISPSGMVSVCSGDQFELICMIPDPGTGLATLQWNTTLELNTTSPMSYDKIILSSVPSDQHKQFVVNSTTLTFSRVSALNEFPLVSSLLINPVTNGVSVRCRDDISLDSSTVVVSVTNGHPIQDTEGANLTEEYGIENDGVSITLEWAQIDPTYSYQVVVVPNLPLNFSTSTHVQIRVPYNSPHNVSIIASSCGQHSTTVFFKEVFYSKCVNPVLTDGQVSMLGFTEPAVEDSMVVFACPAGLELSGPNTSICTGNGEWEPDPTILTCTAVQICGNPEDMVDNSVTILGYAAPAVEGTTVIFQCPPGLVLDGANSSTCMGNGEWEPHPREIHCFGSGDFIGLTNNGKIAVASSVTAFVVGSILFFIVGFLCGHNCRKKKKSMAPAASQCEKATHGTPYYDDVVLNQQQELELKENVAYAPVR